MKNIQKNIASSINMDKMPNNNAKSEENNYSDNEMNKNFINKDLPTIKPKKSKKKVKNRRLNSLEELTKKFVQCVYEENNNIINLKKVIEKIKVKKRRIYDITNVLEGKWIYNLFINILFRNWSNKKRDKKSDTNQTSILWQLLK